MRARAGLALPLVFAGALLVAPTAGAQNDVPADPGDLRVEAGVAPGTGPGDPRPGEAFADPKVADLQRTASDVQKELGELAGRIEAAEAELGTATAQLQHATAERLDAEAQLTAIRGEADEFTRSVFTSLGRPDNVRLLFSATNASDLLNGKSMVDHLREDQDARLNSALDRQRRAVEAEGVAAGAEKTAAERKAELDSRNGDATNRADAISSELRGPIDDANAAVVEQQRAQRDRNSQTASNWKAYTDRLAAAGIKPPSAAALADPAKLPAGLRPLAGSGGPQAGVAESSVDGQRILVLPKETIDAVTAGIGALGKPYVPKDGGEGPVAYSCDGLVRSVFSGAGLPLPGSAGEQLAVGKPVPLADAQPGDLVFIGPAKYGVQSVGVVLDSRTMLAADARLAGVVVADLPAGDSVLGVARPALGTREAVPVPQRGPGELTWRCGGVELPPAAPGTDQAAGAWGGFPNGLIPAGALCPIGIGSHVLRCDAAQTFAALSSAFAGTFGRPLCVTDSYRTFAGQVDLYRRKPSLAAVPGTSNHGWGLAVDMCGGVQSFGTPEYGWLAANARSYGWVNPGWAQPGRGREEPWHWEFAGR
ncbi:D-alanyl-D-alanine carboxypeptidase family protein [Amycolatopsis sp. 195334CR]|uniref:D-alanyl-D-alanine carboxypeptidase family protein n=1 Tax=Amycolatopsis sp. 195334CR TaxID=2814588 RepID=UPI001A8FA3AE|nr:D-alanyl-D-alanine carboxypeptidase family protein [Amycolatopsis sp. 195334CR]MBN6041772.1 D-alanyl-D-alanine carboxypeptidase family protein [Amycolatopsis sp. 195334CR]